MFFKLDGSYFLYERQRYPTFYIRKHILYIYIKTKCVRVCEREKSGSVDHILYLIRIRFLNICIFLKNIETQIEG